MRRALYAMWLVLSTSVRVSPKQTAVALAESLSNGLTVLQPLFLSWFIAGAVDTDTSQMIVSALAFGAVIGISEVLMITGNTARITMREKVGFAFDTEIATKTAEIPTLDHLESAHYLDELQALHDQQSGLGDALNSVLNTLRWAVYAGGTVALATSADWRLLLIAVAGLPNLATTAWSVRWQAAAEKASAEPGRLTTHLVEVGTTPLGAAETRVFGLRQPLHARLRDAVAAWRAPMVRLGAKNGAADAANAVLFFGTVTAVLAWMLHDLGHGTVEVAAFVLAVLLVERLQHIGDMVQWSIRNLSRTVRTTNRLLWLRDYHAQVLTEHPGRREAPAVLTRGIRTEGLGYHYPDTHAPALHDVSLDLPAGSVVALVGENGAGKSTLVKLLTGMYRPTEGRVVLDDVDLAEFDLAQWRARTSGAFQDYARLELSALESVGVGDLPRVHDEPRVHAALASAASDSVVRSLPDGLRTQLGSGWPDGVDLSGGQWQRLAIGRGMMRDEPLLLVLDEPTAALDAATEHALFQRYAEAARSAGRRGAVTLLVTHRFSTVAAADLVVVLDRGRVSEVGTHAELVGNHGRYAELYELQARGYR